MELLELYTTNAQDWLRFLDEEILLRLARTGKGTLGHPCGGGSARSMERVGRRRGLERNTCPKTYCSHGLLLELEEGMWLHEALRERLRRDVGVNMQARRERLK